ncbi:MAG: hypothetical protein FWD96_06935, partial [Defluviitaleaceae bacterium]|nr:hypothetical protein [Defluviitaleaceae bacterium]
MKKLMALVMTAIFTLAPLTSVSAQELPTREDMQHWRQQRQADGNWRGGLCWDEDGNWIGNSTCWDEDGNWIGSADCSRRRDDQDNLRNGRRWGN